MTDLLGYIVWDPVLGYLWGALLVPGVFLCLYLSYRRITRRFSGWAAAKLMVPRVIVGILLLMLFFDPRWAITRQVNEELRFLFLRDQTASMEVADRNETPRADRIKKTVRTFRERLPDNTEVKEQPFKRGIGETDREQPDGDDRPARTHLAQVLMDVTESQRARNWDSVVILSDGGDERFRVGSPPPVPVYFYVTGTKAGDNDDLAIRQLDAPSEVQKQTEFDVQVDLLPYGRPEFLRTLGGLEIQLQKRSENDGSWETIDRKDVDLSGGRRSTEFTVDGLEREGRHEMRVQVESVSGELTELNNERLFTIDVVDRSLEALLFTARPGQNEMILRRALEGDSGIGVTSLIRLQGDRYMVQRSPKQKKQNGADEKTPLSDGFPSSTDRLNRFDVVVIGSFPATVWNEQQMKSLVGFVREGGAAVFLGGEDSFGRGGYAETPLASLIPWRITPDEPELDVGRRGVTVTPAVVEQRVIQGWAEKMSAAHPLHIHSLNRPGKLRRGAVGLLNAASEDGEVPVLAVQTYGRGRVLGAATNTIWRWRTEGNEKRAAYNHLWRQGLRYLAGTGEGSGLMRVQFNRDHYYPGETAEIDVEVAGEYAEGTLRVEARRIRGENKKKLALERRAGSVNRFRTTTLFPQRGRYRFKFTAYHNNDQLETYETTVAVGARMNEGARVYPDVDFLEDVASGTGGASFREGEEGKLLEKLRSQAVQRETRRMVPLVQYRSIYLALIILTLVAEWIIRRRMNLF